MKRRNYLLLTTMLVVTLVMPAVVVNNRTSMPYTTPLSIAQPASTTYALGTLEYMMNNVDAWGGVNDVILSMQNATHYPNAHVQLVEDVMANQMATEDGYVKSSVLSVNGMVAFPNGIMGGPMITLVLKVVPVLIVPENRADTHFATLTIENAIDLAEEVVDVYESELAITMSRLTINEMNVSYEFSYNVVPPVDCHGIGYQLTYVTLLTASQGGMVIPTFLGRLALMGGFMSMAGAPGWIPLQTAAAEAIMAAIWLPHYQEPDPAVMELLGHTDGVYMRAHSSHNDIYNRVNTLLIGAASLQEPGYVEASAGYETYSLKQHVGYTSNIKNKMAEDSSAYSISMVVGTAPAAALELEGWPADLVSINDQFKIPVNITIPGGIVIPANSTVSDIIRTYLSYMPIDFAYMVNEQLGMIDPTAGDYIIDSLWGGTYPLPDFRDMLRSLNFSTMPQTAVKSINFDLLSQIMARAGMNPNALMSRLDTTLATTNPLMAIADAFVKYFDSYHLLDLLANETYGDPVALEAYLNTFIAGFEQFLKDFAGADFAEQFQTKEGIAEFVEEHWDIVLQALWTAMANGNLTAIKEAIHEILDPTNIQTHVTPYLMADLGASLVGGIGLFGGINLDKNTVSFPDLENINVEDLVLKFDADPEGLEIAGPYLIVTKHVTSRAVDIGTNVRFNITVHNYGNATAYDIKVLDSATAGFDGEREFYWTRDSLAPGDSWLISFTVEANQTGLYMDMPVICVYFNASLSGFDPNDSMAWGGTARYTWSAIGYQIQVVASGGWWEGTILGIPTLVVVGAIGGAAIVGVMILLVRRR